MNQPVSNLEERQADKRMLRALRGQQTDRPPFWFMRQAGRYLPEYREIRQNVSGFLELCYTPELATEVTLQPIRRYGMDAAILFADILLVCDALGQDLAFQEGEGPVLAPIRKIEDIDRLDAARCDETLSPVYETVRRLSKELPPVTTLIGFAGAPWTVACYMVEGHGSKDFAIPRLWALQDPDGFQQLIDLIVQVTIDYLSRQIDAGAEAVQLFDSWAGLVPAAGFGRWCVQPTAKIVAALKAKYPEVGIIAFPKGAGTLLDGFLLKTGADVLGIDHFTAVDWARDNLQSQGVLQGNLDPLAVVAGGDDMINQARHILETLSGKPHIFNLGHGFVPQTPPEHVEELSNFIKSWS